MDEKKAPALSPAAEGALARLIDATLANKFEGRFTTTEVARCIGIEDVPRAAHLVGELHRAGLVVAGAKLVPRERTAMTPRYGEPGYRSAVAWRVSRKALLDEIQALRRALWKAEHPENPAGSQG